MTLEEWMESGESEVCAVATEAGMAGDGEEMLIDREFASIEDAALAGVEAFYARHRSIPAITVYWRTGKSFDFTPGDFEITVSASLVKS